MRKIVFYVYLILIVSCSKHNTPLNEKILPEEGFTLKKYSSKSMIKEKFLEFYELKLLLANNTQFKDNIESRLTSFRLNNNEVLKITPKSKIKNLVITKLLMPKKSSESRLKILYEISVNNMVKKDSIIAHIIDNKIIIKRDTMNNRKIKFSRFKP